MNFLPLHIAVLAGVSVILFTGFSLAVADNEKFVKNSEVGENESRPYCTGICHRWRETFGLKAAGPYSVTLSLLDAGRDLWEGNSCRSVLYSRCERTNDGYLTDYEERNWYKQ